jgi:hypothetical protein
LVVEIRVDRDAYAGRPRVARNAVVAVKSIMRFSPDSGSTEINFRGRVLLGQALGFSAVLRCALDASKECRG